MTAGARLARWNALPAEAAERELADACAARRWVVAVAAERPFDSFDSLVAAAERAFDCLAPEDWLEALAAHPRIGERADAGRQSARGERFSAGEQAGAADAPAAVATALAAGNWRYEARFGHTYVVCASGRSGEEMLALLERRLANEPAAELVVAAEEQRRITRLRLERLFGDRARRGSP